MSNQNAVKVKLGLDALTKRQAGPKKIDDLNQLKAAASLEKSSNNTADSVNEQLSNKLNAKAKSGKAGAAIAALQRLDPNAQVADFEREEESTTQTHGQIVVDGGKITITE